MSRVEEILTFHSSSDSALMNEIIRLCSMSDPTECKKVFLKIRNNLFPSGESKRVQEYCVSKGIHTSAEYSLLSLEMPELPIDPRPKNTSWYEYLHPVDIKVRSFVKDILKSNNLRVEHEYNEWLNSQQSHVKATLPSVQNINDGYFGSEYTKFNDLLSVQF